MNGLIVLAVQRRAVPSASEEEFYAIVGRVGTRFPEQVQ